LKKDIFSIIIKLWWFLINKPLLVEKSDLDEQIAKLLIANWSYITYLERKLGYYNDDTDSLIWAKILNVKLKKKS